MTTTKIIKFYKDVSSKFSPAFWHIRDGLTEKPINIVKDIFGKNILSEEDTTVGLDRTIFTIQDANGNFKLAKGLWRISVDCIVELKGNLAFASTHLICLNLSVKKNGVELNERASAPCVIDYFKEEVLLKIENDADLINMSFYPKIYGEVGTTNLADIARKDIQSNIRTPEFGFKKLSFIAEKIGDLE